MAGFDIPDNDVAFNAHQSIWYSTDIDILTAGLNGVGVVSGCAVTAQGSPDMTVAVAAGTIRIASGLYVTVSSGNGTIGTADGSNPRIDLVSSSDSGTKTVTAGTAAAQPKPPALPSGHVALAMVYVPASDTTIATNQITDKRVILPSGGFLDWTPALTAATSNPTLGSGSEAYGRYTQHEGLVIARGHIKFGTSGTNAGSGAYRISLPLTAASPAGSVGVYGHGYLYDDSSGTLKQHTLGYVTTSTVQFILDGVAGSTSPVDAATPWAWAANDYLLFLMEYEAA